MYKLYKTNNECFHLCNGTNTFIQWKTKCSIKLGFASLNGTFHLSPHENICTTALINIHYLYTNPCVLVFNIFLILESSCYSCQIWNLKANFPVVSKEGGAKIWTVGWIRQGQHSQNWTNHKSEITTYTLNFQYKQALLTIDIITKNIHTHVVEPKHTCKIKHVQLSLFMNSKHIIHI